MLNLDREQINLYFPISGFVLYPGGLVLKRTCLLELGEIRHTHLRGIVAMLSKRSLNRLALLVRSCGVKFTSVLTLTYGPNYPMSGKVAKRHLNAFLVAARREFGPFEYFWICEFQNRGAVHFHIATTLPPPDEIQRHAFAMIWVRLSVPGDWLYTQLMEFEGRFLTGQTLGLALASYSVHSHPKAWEGVRKDDGMQRYMAKYANKLRQKEVPPWYQNVGRFWGTSRGVKLPEGEVFYGTESEVREVLAYRGRNVETWEILPKIMLT